ncbi:MAG: AAA family ATPase [Acidobacteriota bacterium]|nr:AAA family ATPase [Acidobacteriota bacterium]
MRNRFWQDVNRSSFQEDAYLRGNFAEADTDWVNIEPKDLDPSIIVHGPTGSVNIYRPTREVTARVIQPGTNKSVTFAGFAYSGGRGLTSHQLKAISELESDPLAGALSFKNVERSDDLIQWIATTKAKAALETVGDNPDAAAHFTDALERLDRALSDIIGSPVRFVLQTRPLHLRIELEGKLLELNVLPDGLKSIISWLGDLLMRLDRLDWANDLDVLSQNFMLLLDEIDIHLHPSWQRKVLPVVRRLFPNAQIFCSTHSPFVVNSIDNAWVYAIDLENGLAKTRKAVLSQEARSYAKVLSEIFGVKQRFGPEVEKRIDAFYDLRTRLLGGEIDALDAFVALGKELAETTLEVRNIVIPEIRQIEKALRRETGL